MRNGKMKNKIEIQEMIFVKSMALKEENISKEDNKVLQIQVDVLNWGLKGE